MDVLQQALVGVGGGGGRDPSQRYGYYHIISFIFVSGKTKRIVEFYLLTRIYSLFQKEVVSEDRNVKKLN